MFQAERVANEMAEHVAGQLASGVMMVFAIMMTVVLLSLMLGGNTDIVRGGLNRAQGVHLSVAKPEADSAGVEITGFVDRRVGYQGQILVSGLLQNASYFWAAQ